MSYLTTLRRIPDDIILAIAAQDFDEAVNHRCICGWAFRESLARELNIAPESASVPKGLETNRWTGLRYDLDTYELCAKRFGGSEDAWWMLYTGATEHTARVESAFVDRLNEIVS